MAVEGATVLGKSIRIRGEVTGAEDVVLYGTLEGSITLTESRLTVGQDANVQAQLTVHDAVVVGTVHGNVIADGRVELRKGAVLMGDVTAARLSIEDGASIKGKVALSGTKE